MNTLLLLSVIFSLAAGLLIGWLLGKFQSNKLLASVEAKQQEQENRLQETTAAARQSEKEKQEYLSLYQTVNGKLSVLEAEQKKHHELQQVHQQTLHQLAVTGEQLQAANERFNTQKQELEQIGDRFRHEFKVLAQGILEGNSQKFTEVNEQKLKTILDPLKTELGVFKQKVEETYDKESKERFTLGREVQRLIESSQLVSEQANNLTTALKGNKKLQGNWGEMILESILENSGLIKGSHFKLQEMIKDHTGVVIKDDEGRALQPDVTIYYPDDRKIIIDSKVSLLAYENAMNATGKDEANQFMNEHIRALKTHVDGLSKKRYPKYAKALDYVLMFVPVEPAFLEALKADHLLWKYAYDKGIILVSPTNLLAILKIVEEMWKVDKQTKNAEEIASQAGVIYDKFVNFLGSFKAVGDSLGAAQSIYDNAFKQLASGQGNFSKQVEKLKLMGAKTIKSIPGHFQEE